MASLRAMNPPRPPRVRIYQLLPRLFGNTNETRQPHGTLAQNGVGKFADINDTALASLRAMGFTHLWLTGVLRQATATDYASIGLYADDPDLLKGLAGSPFAIKDLFDVCPDYALDPADRLAEFRALLDRIHAHGLGAIIDFVANHVARSYRSLVRADLDFGAHDDRTRFFAPGNNFFYLQRDSPGGGPPLHLPTFADGRALSPTCRALGGCDGLFIGELDHGKVTGNNAVTWAPGLHDWYETAKLNYGFDFTTGTRAYPHAAAPDLPIPDTWHKMDAVLAHWQRLGVDGFRCDMAHMVPPEFWAWAVARARQRQPGVLFLGEAYDNDPMKVGPGNVLHDLLRAGFDAVYDDPAYKILKQLYDGPKWANDLDAIAGDRFLFERSLRYAENHDEVRLAGAGQWGDLGPAVGRPVSAILYGLARGPVLLFSGQEVGEPARDAEGFGGDDARTTIFDYWSMPELAKWVNSHRHDGARLSAGQRELRDFYARLLALVGEPAFRDGDFFPLNRANVWNDRFGRLPGETASGHWLYAFLRRDAATGQSFLIAANLHAHTALRDLRIHLPAEALTFLGHVAPGEVRDRLGAAEITARWESASASPAQLHIPEFPPLTPACFELRPEAH
jgi:glycosidase